MASIEASGSVGSGVKSAGIPPSPDFDVAVIGAGPYGLASAAHLEALGLKVIMFGEPMEFWAEHMPVGMLLRSPREASTIADPRDAWTLEAYEAANGVAPVKPLPLTTFVAYGRWFEQNLKSERNRARVAKVSRNGSGFKLDVQGGSSLTSRRVVVAAGIGPFERIPSAFANLAHHHFSHCYRGVKITDFNGRRITVIGSGQSSLECAALLHEGGADVELIARRPFLRWIGMHPKLHSLGILSKMLYSKHDIGPVGISRLVAYPDLLYHFPMGIKDKIRVRAVRPAGSNWLPARLANVKKTLGCVVESATSVGDEVQLKLSDGTERRTDHVLLGTGYTVDLARYSFLAPDIVKDVRQLDGYPDLAAGFRSSIPGLHFVGAPASRNFGPLFYFVTGTEWCARGLASYIAKNRAKVKD